MGWVGWLRWLGLGLGLGLTLGLALGLKLGTSLALGLEVVSDSCLELHDLYVTEFNRYEIGALTSKRIV